MRVRMAGGLSAAVLLFPAAAPAQDENGVVVDPDSPSAKQYSIPLERERREADPAQEPGAGIEQAERTAPLFGAGITESEGKPASPPPSDEDTAARSEPRTRPDDALVTSRRERDREIVKAAAARPGSPDGGLGVTAAIGGAAAAVLLVGGVAGLLLRRRE